ncbi:hypothetical protein IEO21_05483 [Rhodonia placenta]|uniref:NAD(P)-binding protein n=1 Tax=Rhodonia placenta TaxID=104341 RepID=A0A8H7P1Y2_9APHY|nr:hypothetical protein IEO21_05483 [Postia placenta]
MSSDSFSNTRVWFITGSSQGLGRALLEEVLASGERAVATLRTPAVLAPLAQKYPAAQLLVVPLDVADTAQISAAFGAARAHFGRLDVVVNNAGYGLEGEIEAVPEEDARRQMEVLFWGPVHVTKEAIAFFRDVNPPGHGGRVLNVSSCGGYAANPTLAYYSAGKFAMEGFTEAFTKEMLPEWNIKGVIVEPGGFRTAWNAASMVRVPAHPQYAAPTSPSSVHRKMAAQPYIGDPAKAARAMMQIAGLPDPPLRIQMGTESLMLVRGRALRTIRDGEQYEELAHSTNCDGVDRNKVMEWFKDASI